MVDNTSSEQEIRWELQASIRSFAEWASRADWVTAGKLHAQQHGPYTQRLPEVSGGSVTFKPDGVEWRFICSHLSDDCVLLVREGGSSWEILHDRYGTGDRLVPLYNDDIRTVTGINTAQFWNVSCGFRASLEDCVQIYFGGPIARRNIARPPVTPKFHWKKEYTPIAIVVGVVALLLLCGFCCVGNYLLAN